MSILSRAREEAFFRLFQQAPWGGRGILAFVALRDGCVTNEDELREHARRRPTDLKVPDKIVFLEKLPKGISGKIQRTTLKEFEIVAA
jgi:acyl-coenzyme A synthetase/AMP-(fatty) acid ligase